VTLPRIYTADTLETGRQVDLGTSSSRHLASALRRGPGDALLLFDGRGGEYDAEIVSVRRDCVSVQVGQPRPQAVESPLSTHLGIGISRGERMDWVVQKATELGISRITPLTTERTGVRLSGDRARRREAHWLQVAISACEQCGRNVLPVVDPITPLADWTRNLEADLKLVLAQRSPPLPTAPPPPAAVALLVGPEGGLSQQEIDGATAQGFEGLGLGPRILRTETAPVVALTLVQARWGDIDREN
jgi:16S rRNA (uracil1498-N3)-methyltransferase